jgi:IS605 OrfB family transposase
MIQEMKLVATIKLLPTAEQEQSLLATLERVNTACKWIGERAFELHSADKLRLHGLYYRTIRDQFGLSAQMAVRAIGKVCDAYKRDRSKFPHFKPHGAIAYDQRILSFKAMDRVSILTLSGRILVPFVCGAYHRARLEGVRGQADLVLRKDKWFLYVTVDVPDGAPIDPEDWLGVDLGIRNLAVDSDGEQHSGADVEKVRQRMQKLRSDLQSAGTKSAKRHLKGLSGHEARFRADVNHTISKRIVAKAKGTGRGIALEDLRGIRGRATVTKSQRAMHSGWAFLQLRSFLSYKGALAGVPVVAVDPRDTSRTCPRCAYIDKANRRSRSDFCCKSCGLTDHADHIGAINIARRAVINRPIVTTIGRETIHPDTSLRSVASRLL